MNKHDRTHNLVGDESIMDKVLKGVNITLGFVALIIAVVGVFILAYGLDDALINFPK